MYKYKKITLASIMVTWFCLLTGCATPPGGYRNTPTARLCMDYLTLPSININQGERANELARRGEGCQGYGAAASARNQSNAQFQQNLQYMNQQSQPATPSTRTYIAPNGKMMNCTTTGTVTNCF